MLLLLLLLLLPLSYALFRTFGAPIYFVALINLPCDFPPSLAVWHCGLWQDSVTCCMRHTRTLVYACTVGWHAVFVARAQQLEYYSFLLYFVALTTINCIKNAVIEYGQRR